MDTSLQFRPEDRLQKTWIPEGTKEYKRFKLITLENNFLLKLLQEKIKISDTELVLDVGGREGDIGIGLVNASNFHLIDPDPTLKLNFKPGKFWNQRIQDIALDEKYKLIICCHVLGYLGTQHVQDEVFNKLLDCLDNSGTLALFYNTNTGYTGELLEFSNKILLDGHYDYFNEDLLSNLDKGKYKIAKINVSFELNYESFDELAHCCWFLYGAKDNDIDGVADKFLPKLKSDLQTPSFSIDERVVLITKL